MTKITLDLITFSGKKSSFSMSSLFQGALMEQTDPSFAEKMHETGLHPYSQYLQFRENQVIWTVSALNREAKEHLISKLESDDFQSVFIRDHQETFSIVEKQIRSISYEKLIRKYYLGQCSHILKLAFVTPTSFKSNGRYQLFPSAKLIFQSLMMKYDQASGDSSIYSEEMVHEFEQYSEIVGYRLKSISFSMEGVRIPSFIGTVTIRIHGPQQLANVAWMLAAYGEYSGIGIKTGAGMGGLQIIEKQTEKEPKWKKKF
jgi:CRISPR-associated endoribonuclease Cas6